MVVIIDIVTSKNENGSDDNDEVIVKVANGIERDIEDLLRQYAQALLNLYCGTIIDC